MTTIEVATVALLLAIAVGVAIPVAQSSQRSGELGAGRVNLLAVEAGLLDLPPDTWPTAGSTAGPIVNALNDNGIDVASGIDGPSQGPDDPRLSDYDATTGPTGTVLVAVSAAGQTCLLARYTPVEDDDGDRRAPESVATTWATHTIDVDAGVICDARNLPAGTGHTDVLGSPDNPTDLDTL
ncbi:hypothetical protein DVS28_b0476 (plasmid) [Euzebya pacifica]|uniref:Uncharacterized protein n=1 Tax=Euzebya pacifica TaxID=1608957 RepID=A0A346Y6W9_9ACTN|nr:hypothetical protein DVS28_b0476 [Euzebya pacifica]